MYSTCFSVAAPVAGYCDLTCLFFATRFEAMVALECIVRDCGCLLDELRDMPLRV